MVSPAPLPDSSAVVPRRRLLLVAGALTLLYAVIAAALHPAYGPTWDSIQAEYCYGEAFVLNLGSGERDYLESSQWHDRLGFREPHPDFSAAKLPWVGTYPFTGFLSGVSCKVLWTELGWVPPLIAHNLAILPFVLGCVFGLVALLGRRYGLVAGICAAVLLVSAPRFFAHSFNNLKDVPEAFLYNATLVGLWLAFLSGKRRHWILVGVLLACSLAQRPNTFFLPPQFLLFLPALFLARRARGEAPVRWPWGGILLSLPVFVVAYLAVSPVFWTDTWDRLVEWTDYTLGFNAVLHEGTQALESRAWSQGLTFEALYQFLITTPPALLLLAGLGLFAPGVRFELRAFLLLGVAVPLGRSVLPGFSQYDGVRHYLEFYPPLCALGGLGVRFLARAISGRVGGGGKRALVSGGVALVCLAPGVWATATTHPHGIAYFNAFVGGLEGAQTRGVREATDYWGNSYWEGLAWLDAHAEENATLIVPIARHIVDCAAPVRLRSDLHLPRDGSGEASLPLYVMYITRPGWYTPLIAELDARPPTHEIRVQGAPILRIHRLDGDAARVAWRTWSDREAGRARDRQLLTWLKEDPARMNAAFALLNSLPTLGEERVLDELRALVPESYHADLPRLVAEYGLREPTTER